MRRRMGKGTELSKRQHKDTPTSESTGNFQGSPRGCWVWVCGPRRGWGFRMPELGFPLRQQGEAVGRGPAGKDFQGQK